MKITKETVSDGIVVFQKVIETAQGGFTLETSDLVVDANLKAGTLIGATVANETARRVTAIKTVLVYENASNTATDIKIAKGHHFKVGNYLAAVKGGKAYAITVIDTSNALYDTITVGTTLGVALTVGDVLFQSTATGASVAIYVRPLGLLYEDTTIASEVDVAVVIRGTVYGRRTPGLHATILADIPNILVSNSY